MNKSAFLLELENSFYANPHGLGNLKNVSSVKDVSVIT